MPRRSRQWVWAGRGAFGVIVVALVSYLVAVGLDKADKLGSGIGAVLALLALAAPYLLPAPAPSPAVARATGAGSVAVGGDLGGEVRTEVSGIGSRTAAPPPGGPGVTASGAGSVAVGGSSTRPIRTKVTGNGDGPAKS